MSLYGLDHDRAFALCEADYLREPAWREPSEDDLDAADAAERLRALEDAGVEFLPAAAGGWTAYLNEGADIIGEGATLDAAVVAAFPLAVSLGLVTL